MVKNAQSQRLRWLWSTDQMRPPLFRRLLSQHPAPHTPEGPSRLLPGSSPLPWPSLSLTSSAPSGSRCRANIPTLQDSLHVTGCCFALLPQEDTPLQHNRSPGSTGSLLRGLLAVTTVGLPPTSRRQLSGHTSEMLGAASPHPLTPYTQPVSWLPYHQNEHTLASVE